MAIDPKLGLHLLSLALACSLVCLAMAAPGGKSPLAQKLQPFVDDGTTAGVVVLTADKDKILSLDTVGYEDLAAKTPMRPDSLFWIASQSKSITATALMMLVDEGKVNVDDPVEKYLPEFHGQMVLVEHDATHMLLKPPAHPITVREILSHTSGLPFMSPVEQPRLGGVPLRIAVLSYASLPLQYEPGTKYEYSNEGINTAGRIIEVVSGMPYEDFLQQRLFDPLGMTDTTFWPTAEQTKRLARTYGPNEDHSALVEVDLEHWGFAHNSRTTRFPVPAGGLFSTAADVAKFCRMILSGGQLDGHRYLSEKAVHHMTSRQTPAALPEDYGFGWGTGASYGHGGAFKTSMNIDPRLGLITVFMVQSTGWRDEEHGNLIFATFLQEATHRAALAAAAIPLPYAKGTVLVHQDAQQPVANLLSVPFTAQPGKLHALTVALHYSHPVKGDAWVGVGFCDAEGKKGPWMLVRPQESDLADGQMVGFTDNDLHVACRGTAYAPLYPDITATVTWDAATNECRYYVNNILQGSAVLPAPPAVDHIFVQDFQTGGTVTVKDVRLTVQ